MLRKEAFMNKNLVERPRTLLGNSIPEGARIAGYLNGAAGLLNDEVIARIPLIGKPLKAAGLATGMIGEIVTNTSVFNPDMFWATVDRNLQDITWGKGQTNDISNGLDAWFGYVVDVLQDKKLDTYSAGFIYAGMQTLSARMSAPGTTRLSEQMKEAYGKMYQKLVTADQLKGGWKQIHADYTTQLRSSGINVNVVNPVIDSTHKSSGMVDFFSASVTDSVIGISGKNGKYFKDENGKHIFEKEWSNFVTSNEFLEEPVETKTKLLVEARNTLPQAFVTEKNPEQAAALQNAYIETSSVIVNPEYATYRVRVIATAAGAAEKGDPGRKDEVFKVCMDGIREELEPLLSLLADTNSGVDGLLTNATTADSVEGTIAQAVQAQYQELLTAIEGSKGSLELRGMFIEIAKEKVLEALKRSRYEELKDLYRELVVDVDPAGVAKMYARKFDKKGQVEIDAAAQALVDDLSKKFLDPIYGVSEDSTLSLADVFLEEAKDMIAQVSKLNPQLGAAIATAAEGILETIAKKETTEQKAKGLKILYTTIQEGFRESTSINIAQALCHETDSSEIAAELKKIEEAGDLPEHVDEEYTLQLRETLENRAANTFWNEVVGKVTNQDYGANGTKIDISLEEMALITKVEEHLATKSPEYQRRYMREGLVVMLNSFTDLRDKGNHAAIAALQTMVHSLVEDKKTMIGGKAALLISWMEKPEELEEMFAKMSHDVYGFGSMYSVYGDIRALVVDFVELFEQASVETTATSSGQMQYTAFKLLEDNIVIAIRTATDTGLQKELSDIYTITSEKLGKGAMKYLSQGKHIQEAERIIGNLSVDDEVQEEMEIRFQKAFPKLDGLKGEEKDEHDKILAGIYSRELQGVWAEYWDNYYDIVYGDDTAQGKPGSLVEKAKENHKAFQEALSHEDSSYVCSFLDAGITAGFEKFKQAKDQDVQKRIGFGLFELLGHSESVLVKSLKARENGAEGEFGAKSVRTLGSVQVSFIRRMIADPDLMKIAFQYIETKPEEGKRKDAEELSLCMTVLMTARDAQFQRHGDAKYTEAGLETVVKGKSPSKKVLAAIEPALLASVESATNNLEGDNPELNVIFEILAALDTFSPSVLTRLGFAVDDLRNLKDTRKQSSVGTRRAIAALEEANLSPEELFSRIYTATGKHYFGNDFAPRFSEDIVEIIRNGIIPEGKKNNLLNKVLMYRDDICQVVKTPPGLQLFFGEDWEPSAVPHLRSTFDKYLAGFDRRLYDRKITHAGAKSLVATELLGISMIFETFDGQSDEAKRGPHLQFIHTLSGIIVDGMQPAGQRIYSDEIHKVAEYILRESVPYWSKEFVKDFFTVMATRAQNVDGNWVESGRWRSMCNMVTVLDGNHKPLVKDGAIMTSKGQMVRGEIAEIAVDATLKVLSGYTFMGGPQNIRLVSDIVNGVRLDDMDEISLKNAPKEDNFIIQAIGIVNWYGQPKHKKAIIHTLEKLGREEALLLAQSKYMRPPQDVSELVAQNKQIAHAMGEDIKTIFTEYAQALQAVTTGVKTIFTENEDGTLDVEGLPDDFALKRVISSHERTIMSDAVRVTGYAAVQKQAQDALKALTPEKIKKMDGVALLRVIMTAATAGSGGNTIIKDLVDVFEKLVVNVGGKNGTVVVPQPYDDESFSLFIHKLQTDTGLASMLSTMGAQNDRVGEIVQATMESVTGLRKDLVDMAEKIAKATGSEKTAETAEEVTQALLKQIIAVVQDETSRQQVVGLMKKAQAERYQSEAQVWNEAEKELEAKRANHMKDELGSLYEAAGKELAELKKRREQFYASRMRIITTMNSSVEEASKDMTDIVKEATELDMKAYPKYLAWLGRTLNRDAAKQEGTVNIQERLTSYAEYCNRHTSGQFGMMSAGAAAIATYSVLPRHMAWTPAELLRIHGLVMDGSKIRALTQEELAAELVQEKLI